MSGWPYDEMTDGAQLEAEDDREDQEEAKWARADRLAEFELVRDLITAALDTADHQ